MREGNLNSGNNSLADRSPLRSLGESANRGIRQLPYAKYIKQKEGGLCFGCGLKFNPLHKCPQRQLQVLILVEELETKEEGEFVMVEAKKEEEIIDYNLVGSDEVNSELMLQVMRRGE